MKKVLGIFVMLLILTIMVISVSFSTEQREIYGYTASKETTSFSFLGTELDNVDSIISNLAKFPKVENVSLGSFDVHVEDRDKLQSAFPNVEFSLNAFVTMYGENHYTTESEIDLSEKGVTDITELYDALEYMPNVRNVTLGDTPIPAADRERLQVAFPNVDFEIIATYDIYGQTLREDVTKIDLRKAVLDDKLGDNLRLFKDLSFVDMHSQNISLDKKMALMNEFPDIDFSWDLELMGEKYDSTIKELDLSNVYMPPYLDELRKMIPYFKDLKFIDMSDCGIDNETMAAFRDEFPDIKIVWRLYLGVRWSLRTDQVAFSVLIYAYDYPEMTTDDIQVLKYCTDLQALDLGHQSISDISVIGEYLKDLRILIMADNALTDISPLANLKHLHYLEFFVNNVTDLTPLASCTELVDLNISYNHSLSDITPILNLPKLERLWLEHCNVSYDDVQKLYAAYPDATIVPEGTGSVDMGWRAHDRYFAMIDMFIYNQWTMSEEFSKYD